MNDTKPDPAQVIAGASGDRPELSPMSDEERSLRDQIDKTKLPSHIAIIMDGNGRWAGERGLTDRIRGHEAGSESVRFAVRTCGELGVGYLTLYAFSVENWSRPKYEVMALMELLKSFLLQEAGEIRENNVRVVTSGRTDDLPESTRAILEQSISESADNTGLVLNLALSYGGRAEIVDSVKKIAVEVEKGLLSPDAITEDHLSQRMYHPEIPDPDLLIRTSGEMRVSNFLLWEIAYTEIFVSQVLWPDFRRTHLFEAILNFQRRERRYGKVTNT